MAHKVTEYFVGQRTISLNSMEERFLRLCCTDLPYRSIAERMGKSPRTIDSYRDDLLLRLRVRSRTGLILWSIKFGLVKVKDIKI